MNEAQIDPTQLRQCLELQKDMLHRSALFYLYVTRKMWNEIIISSVPFQVHSHFYFVYVLDRHEWSVRSAKLVEALTQTCFNETGPF